MPIDPAIFPVEDLDLDRLHANLVEVEETKALVAGMLGNDLDDEERVHYEAKLAETEDQDVLLRELIARKRNADGTT